MMSLINHRAFLFFVFILVLFTASYGSAADKEVIIETGNSVIKGRVVDVNGNAVKGSMIFVYKGPDVRQEGDFISAPTDENGMYSMIVPPGEYWVVARLKLSKSTGPLMPGDKHSGDPEVVEIDPGSEFDIDFVVANLREAMKAKRESMEKPFKISGRIIDENGATLSNAYAIANINEKVVKFPKYLSTWTDNEGRYTLYVPRGKYYIGGALNFPPGSNYFMNGEMTIDSDISGLDIIIKAHDKE